MHLIQYLCIDKFINNFLAERHLRQPGIVVYSVFDSFQKQSWAFSKSKRLYIDKVYSYQVYQSILININWKIPMHDLAYNDKNLTSVAVRDKKVLQSISVNGCVRGLDSMVINI